MTRLAPEPLFEAYYLSHRPVSPPSALSPAVVVVGPYSGGEQLTEGLDWEAEQGEKAFWAVMGGREGSDGNEFFPKQEAEDGDPGEDAEI